MNAAEIIEMIKKLSPEERAEVLAYLMKLEETSAEAGRVEEPATGPKIRFISSDEFDKFAPKIFAENRDLLRRLAQ